jgi:hypothetical protein
MAFNFGRDFIGAGIKSHFLPSQPLFVVPRWNSELEFETGKLAYHCDTIFKIY